MSIAAKNNLFIVPPIIQKVIITSGLQYVSAQSSLEFLSSRLCATAEGLYLNRDFVSLSQVADALCTLPHPGAHAAGLFYLAMCERKAGREESAATLFESVLQVNSAPRYRARALQSLGVIRRVTGQYAEAFRLYGEAIAAAKGIDFIATVRAGMTISELYSLEDDHYRALDQLREIRPAVEIVSKVQPYYSGLYCNEVAFELSCIGRLEEARRFACYALASPFAPAYPEWKETAQQIEQQAEAKPSHNRNIRPALKPARKTSPKPKLRLVKKPDSVALTASTWRRTGPVATIRPEQPRRRPILKQISFKIKIRAPSF